MAKQRMFCPYHCGNEFYATAHVIQDWKVDEQGNFLEDLGTAETTHAPDFEDYWACVKCGSQAEVGQ